MSLVRISKSRQIVKGGKPWILVCAAASIFKFFATWDEAIGFFNGSNRK